MDDVEYIDPEANGGVNLFAYCNNNPVMNVDPSGHFVITALLIGLGVGAAVGFGKTISKKAEKVLNGVVSPIVEHAVNSVFKGEAFSKKDVVTQILLNGMFGLLKYDFQRAVF